MKTIEHATAADIGILPQPGMESDPATVELLARIDEYLSIFAKPTKPPSEGKFAIGHNHCPKCDLTLDGLLGDFRWGYAHGEGNCPCGWPCRALHTIPGFDGRATVILAYHPDQVKKKHS